MSTKLECSSIAETFDTRYYGTRRRDIEPLLPSGEIARILDVGCGAGATASWLKLKYHAWTAGIEIVPQAARQAEACLDAVFVGNAETDIFSIPERCFDLILCLDVLEHMRDPWSTIKKLVTLLTPNGILITSIPNIGHYSIVKNLMLGRWKYGDQGLLDRTHLRFFVHATAKSMLEAAGLMIDCEYANMGRATRFVNVATFHVFSRLLTYQYLFRCKKVDGE